MSKIKRDPSTNLNLVKPQKQEVVQDIKKLQLPKQSKTMISRIISSGSSNIILFAGKDNSSKLLTAGYIACKLNHELYKVDLGIIVNKYIGETEKNLSRLFDQAEKSNWILFFDEADALFGKRTNIKDSHDRYANMEVSHLLKHLESYKGIAIIATNLESVADQSFVGQLNYIVQFPAPIVKKRTSAWWKGGLFLPF